MRILVTGGGGFLGSYLVKRLKERGYQITVYGRSPRPQLEAQGFRVFQGDIADSPSLKEACQGMDAVFHIAAKAGVWGSWKSYYEPNVIGTRNVLSACRANGVERLVYTSTPSVVFSGASLQGEDESLPYGRNWLCHYAHTKAIAEREVLEANEPVGLRTIAIRPHLLWGIGDPHLVPRIVQRAKSGRLRIVGAGRNLVDITHVANAAGAHLQALDALDGGEAAGRPFFISQGEPVYLWQWINRLLEGLNIAPVSKRISPRTAYAAGSFLEAIYKTLCISAEPPMTRFLAVELSKDHYFDISAAKNLLGYEPEISTEEGMQELVRNFKDQSGNL